MVEKPKGKDFPRKIGKERFLGIFPTGKRKCPTILTKTEGNVSLGIFEP